MVPTPLHFRVMGQLVRRDLRVSLDYQAWPDKSLRQDQSGQLVRQVSSGYGITNFLIFTDLSKGLKVFQVKNYKLKAP